MPGFEVIFSPMTPISKDHGEPLVLHLVASSGVYGIERALLNLLPALNRAGRASGLACMAGRGDAGARVGEFAEDLGVPVWYAPLDGRLNPRGLFRLHRTISSRRPQLIHCHGYKATILGGAISFEQRRPAVATYHGEANKVLDMPQLSTYLAFETLVLRKLRGVIAVSEPIRRELLLRRVPERRVAVIPNGIDAHSTNEPAVAALVPTRFAPALLVIGRLIREKNIGLALEVLARVRERHPAAGLVVAGDGPLRRELEEKAGQLGVAEWVRFLGFVENAGGLLSRCECFLMPSSTEGLPIALLEAMAAGVPIVASGVGGIPAAVRHNLEALLVPPADGERLFRAVDAVLSDPDLSGAIGAQARQRFASEFTADLMASRYAAFYDRALADN